MINKGNETKLIACDKTCLNCRLDEFIFAEQKDILKTERGKKGIFPSWNQVLFKKTFWVCKLIFLKYRIWLLWITYWNILI